MKRESWKSRWGFILAALGSAVGLGSIWRFPYVVGENGGAIFILLYLIFLFVIGFPVFIAEILVGRTTSLNPSGAFFKIGKALSWKNLGKLTIFTGFIISSFYSVIAGWTLGYLVEAVLGNITHFSGAEQAFAYFHRASSSGFWAVGFHFFFILLSIGFLFSGVRKGIEMGSKVLMPLLVVVLLFLVVKGLTLPGSMEGLRFLFSPNWSDLTLSSCVMALGQAFFTLSLGQGTMVTYGSYLSKKEDIPKSCFPIVIANTLIAILMGMAVFSIVFSAKLAPSAGPSLIFETLPIVFSSMAGGRVLAIFFFLLVTIAALTSQISAMEPAISYLMDEKKWSRHRSTIFVGLGGFLLGIPSALSFGVMKNVTIFGQTFYGLISSVSVNLLVPLGGLFAVFLVAWRWGMKPAFQQLQLGSDSLLHHRKFFSLYFKTSIRYTAPILIILILLDLLGAYKLLFP